jgi:hypothetical protein
MSKLRLTATDRAGNQTTQPFRVMEDTGAPTVTIHVPQVAPLRFWVSWSGEDGKSGLRGYDVQYKVGITGTYDGQPPLISDTIPSDGSVITTAWPVISATLHDPQLGNLSPASGVY